METQIRNLLNFRLPDEVPEGYDILRLTGDASSRSYFRITLPQNSTLILMVMPEPFEIDSSTYLRNYELFKNAGISVAEIYEIQPSRGFVFLQDLGDQTAFDLYGGWKDQTRYRYYLKSLEYLRMMEPLPPVDGLAFTTEKFLWELEFFQQHFLQGFRKISLSEKESRELSEHFGKLAGELGPRSEVFSHRDYHSRNLMIHQEQLFVVDFQDARLGPVTYDLASLCYDSYVRHTDDFRRYLEQTFFLYHPDAVFQRYEYPRMCLQRNLKALGTFGYQTSQLGRTFYAQFVEPTLISVKQHFEKLPEYADLRKILASHLPELG